MLQTRAVNSLRRMAEEHMVDTVRVYRPSTSVLSDDLTETNVPGALVWEGKARISPTQGPREQGVGEGVISMRDADFLIPHDAPLPWMDDEVEVVASADAALVGRWFRITDVRVFSQQAARRFSAIQAQPSRQWGPVR